MKAPRPLLFRSESSLLFAALFLSGASVAAAHPGHGPLTGFASGLAHPLGGWDHLLAMLAVGLWAAQLRAPRLVPAVFLSLVAVGAGAGHLFGAWSGLEQGLAASVLVLGLLVARTVRPPVAVAAVIVGIFAVFHGLAHGAEMPVSAGGLAYGAGFLAATAALLAAGVGAGYLARRRFPLLASVAGWTMAAAGVALLIR